MCHAPAALRPLAAGSNVELNAPELNAKPVPNREVLMKVILAQPRGFCAGVVRAIEIVERALQKFGPPVYVRHEIVHNNHVVESLKAKGARFVEGLSEV